MHLVGITLAAAVAAGTALAANDTRDPYENSSSTWTRNMQAQVAGAVQQYAPAQSSAEQRANRTITLDGRQRWLSVQHLESVRLVDARGQSFVWQAGAPSTFPLKAVAPAGFDSGDVWVAVNHPRDHVAK
jgi:hypothetical protein